MSPKDLQDPTPREKEIALLIAGGLRSCEIAEKLELAVHTVDQHRYNTYAKTGSHGIADLTRYCYEIGWLVPAYLEPDHKEVGIPRSLLRREIMKLLQSAALFLFASVCCAQTTYNVVYDASGSGLCVSSTGHADEAAARAVAEAAIEACIKLQRQDPPSAPPPVDIPLDITLASANPYWATNHAVNAAGAISYEVEQADDWTGPWTLVASVPRQDQTITTFQVDGSKAGRTIWFRWRSVAADGTRGEFTPPESALVPLQPGGS